VRVLFAKRIVFPLQEFIKGKNTLVRAKSLERSQWLARERIRELQFDRLKEHLDFAYQHVPYYRKLFDEHGTQPNRIQNFNDFRKIPCLTRETLRSEFDRLRANTLIRGIQRITTGGSSGLPVTILVDPNRNSFIDAARLRAQRWFEADVGEREIVLWGSPIEVTRQDRIRNLRDRLLNSRLLSAFNLEKRNLSAYVEEISRFRPSKMYGYASALYVLAEHFKKSKRTPPDSLKVIIATAEPLFEFQRRTIEEVFGAKVAVEYGARDAGLVANECPGGGLHIAAEGMLVEVDSEPGGSASEVIVTNLDSRAMPLIRYRTGDIAENEENLCRCGRGLPTLKSVQGRQTDFLLTRDGRLIHALAVIYVLRERPEIKQFQVQQESLTEVTVRIVPQTELQLGAEETIIKDLKVVLGTDMEIKLISCPFIASSPSGKFRYVVSDVARSYFDDSLKASS
jgi:phenylacetate-CoA ligase